MVWTISKLSLPLGFASIAPNPREIKGLSTLGAYFKVRFARVPPQWLTRFDRTVTKTRAHPPKGVS